MKYVIFFFLLLPTALASPFYDSSFNVIEVNQSADIYVNKITDSYILKEVLTDVFFFPQTTDMQNSIVQITTPEATKMSDYLHFKWKWIRDDQLKYNIKSKVRVTSNYPKITNRVTFPIANIPEEYQQYLLPSEKVDVLDPDIVLQARALARDEDDLFKVASKMAGWIQRNIEYDLSTLTAEATQSASWVLQNRQGVCDEVSVLFMAMLRSQGIPARFVSGVAYTESELFPEKWGAHGWVDVFFPGYGWVPFDITYGELGWVDPTHVVFQHSSTPVKPSTEFSWRGRDVRIQVSPMLIDAGVTKQGPVLPNAITLKTEVLRERIDVDSANLVSATIKNLQDYYVTETITLARVDEWLVHEGFQKTVTLEPNEEKKVYWTVEFDPPLDSDFVYTFPVVAYARNINDSVFFTAAEKNEKYTVEDILDIRMRLESLVPIKTFDLSCSPEHAKMYIYENNKVLCRITNRGPLFTGDICLDSDCKKIIVNKTKDVLFEIKNLPAGEQTLLATLKESVVEALAQVKIDVVQQPQLNIRDIQLPKKVMFDDLFFLSFKLVPLSSTIFNGSVTVQINNKDMVLDLSPFDNPQEIVVDLEGKQLRPGTNDIIIIVSFSDESVQEYSVREQTTIELEQTTLIQKIMLFFLNLF